MSLEKTLARLEARAKTRAAKVDPAKSAAIREWVRAHLFTPERWEREKARFAALTHEERLAEVRARLEVARQDYQRAEIATPAWKGWPEDPGLARFRVHALEARLAALEGASEAQVERMAARAMTLLRTGAWQAAAHSDAEATPGGPSCPLVPSDPVPGQEVDELVSFEPGSWEVRQYDS